MCTRFLLEVPAAETGFKKLGLEALAAAVAKAMSRYNIAPGTDLLALRSGEKTRTARIFTPRWGFPSPAAFSSADAAPAASRAPLTNARAETLTQKPSFRDAFRHRRCLIPATGFYEWEKRGRARLPWLFRRAGTAPFAFPGLWEPDADGHAGVVIVTTTPNELMASLHHRMPAMLASAEACRTWLDTSASETDLLSILTPADASQMTATPVSPRMNCSDFDSPECVVPAVHGLAARDETDSDNLALGLG
jgi:Uncharacterized conserved protein